MRIRVPAYGMSAALAILLAIYFLLVPLCAIAAAIVGGTTGSELSLGFLWSAVPWIFPVASLLIVADIARGWRTRQPVRSKLPVFALSSALLAVGAAFALSSNGPLSAVPIVVSGTVFAVLAVGALLGAGAAR